MCILVFVMWANALRGNQHEFIHDIVWQRIWLRLQACARIIVHIEAIETRPKQASDWLLEQAVDKLDSSYQEKLTRTQYLLDSTHEEAKSSFKKSRAYNAYTFNTLHGAVKARNIKAAEHYLAFGSNVKKRDKQGKKPLYYALQNRDERMVTLLLLYGAEPYNASQEWWMLKDFVAQARSKHDASFSANCFRFRSSFM